MNALIAIFLDLSNILGGFLLAIPLLRQIPDVGGDIKRSGTAVDRYGWIIGVVALVTGGYFLLVHLINAGNVLHYEIVAIIVGLLLLTPLMGHSLSSRNTRLFVAIFGIIAILVGLQGLFT